MTYQQIVETLREISAGFSGVSEFPAQPEVVPRHQLIATTRLGTLIGVLTPLAEAESRMQASPPAKACGPTEQYSDPTLT